MHTRSLNPWATVLAVGLASGVLGGCGAHRTSEATLSLASPIIGGVASPSPDDDAVVLVRHTADAKGICTGTLIAHNLVVTARHCVAFGTLGTYQCSASGDLIEGPDGGGHIGADVPAATVEIHVGEVAGAAPAALGAQIVSTLSLTSCLDDLSFIVLARPIAGPVAAVRIGKQTRIGETVTIVGYGKYSDDGDFDWHMHPRRKLPGQIIAAVGPDSTKGAPTVVPRTFEVHGATACDGDSGGPARSEKTGAVVGVSSNRAGACESATSVNSFTSLTPFGSLALQAFAAAGAEPVREPAGLAMGEICQRADDCEHGECAAGSDGTSRCSVVCGVGAPCPAGYSCLLSSDAGSKFCMPDVPPSCPCGSPSCAACEAGTEPPVASATDGGCAVAHGSRRAEPWPGVCLLALVVLTCRRAHYPRRGRSRCPTRTRTAG